MPEQPNIKQDNGNRKGVDRRMVLGAGAVAAAAVGGGLVGAKTSSAATATAPVTAEGPLDKNLNTAPHLFKLTRSEKDAYRGGYLQGANEDTFPILQGQRGSVYFVRLEVGGFREPHWHPTAWELNFVVSGTAKWTILGTHSDGAYRNSVFQAEQGDLVFAPQGHLHYFENARTDMPLEVLVVFNTSAKEPDDDIGVVATLSALPRNVLAAAFGVPESVFAALPTKLEPIVIGQHG
ncbi:cupin domain-containing protein [Nocardia terpenica]|uniref:Cupin n=1 Tax=Nocardia terpenica TaxID=455432 RepID=A0A291RN27_9NOCA|nr:cupin domain-containing protein [Nocardia terpenica]ATL69011.1 cupin [Nocardia terpenica]